MTQRVAGCELCELSAPTVVDNGKFAVILVDDANYPGFARVIWKDHVREVSDLADADRLLLNDAVWKLELAVREFPGLVVDTREIARGGKSYTVDTLAALRAERPRTPLLLLMGADQFRSLASWHRWQALFDLAHLVVVPRPGIAVDATLPAALAHEWQARRIADPRGLRARIAGSIYVQPIAPQSISSTAIRSALARGEARSVEIAGLLPSAVLAYIESNGLYSHPTHAS